MTVEAVEEGDELLATRRVHRQLERGLDRFGAAVCEVRLRRAGHGHDLVELAREVWHEVIDEIPTAHEYQARGLILYGGDDFRVAVARRADGDARVAIEEDVAVNVRHPDAFGVVCDELVIRARIGRRNPLRVRRDNLFGLRAGQSRAYLRPLRGSCY